ncbi:Hypothetical protein XM38_016140 [Halomicronema hongdechloris C2206]|uniref:Uncharacterized protein n=1 Tax=Halomicronema hongdechloris C2206 TaxID=1641165 RepID=A0A1Z3HK28_9CYAN|nr:hypothetical protein [Halomicronema hongdechloris]ASC70669.1 Hypothetical protein XM38_016140 [Halomicronema hongdechloris C2206]
MELSPLPPDLEQAKSLLRAYSFDLGGWQECQLLMAWQQEFEPTWIPMAIVEALYQGRYKVVSVHQILCLWSRRGYPLRHFSGDFDRMICSSIDPCQQRAMSPLSPSKPASPSSSSSTTDNSLPPDPNSSDNSIPSSGPGSSRFSTENQDVHPASLAVTHAETSATEALSTSASSSLSCRYGKLVADRFGGIPPFQPISLATVASSAQDNHSSVVNTEHPQPIQPFVPEGQHSLFYHRLQAVAQSLHYSGSY